MKRLQEALDEVSQLRTSGVSSWTPSFMAWRDRTIQSLEVIHGKDNGYKKRLESLRFDVGRDDLDPRLWDTEPNTFEEDFRLAERLIKDAIEEAPAPTAEAAHKPRTLGDPALMLAAQRIYDPQFGRDIQRSATPQPTTGKKPDSRKVFVVHGRNNQVRDDFFSFLRALGLDPIEWLEAVALTGKASPYVGEVLDAAFQEAQAVTVLLTPDDVVRLSEDLWAPGESEEETRNAFQARPNVLFEAGMAIGRDPVHTLLVQVGTVKKFSDVGGRHILHLTNDSATRQAVAARLQTAGCPISMTKTDWLRIGDFESVPTKAPSETKKPVRQKRARKTSAKPNKPSKRKARS